MSDTQTEIVGRVVGLWRYPVKSMCGEALQQAEVGWNGFAGDRRWAFVRADAGRSGFPWFTLRERSDMSDYTPSLADPSRPDSSATVVRTPSGESLDVTDPALRQQLSADDIQLIRQDRGIFDTFPLSLITTATIHQLGERVGENLDVRRFRPNLLVATTANEPFVEDQWVGRTLKFGSARMRVDKRDGRCVVITIDPDTAERRPEILKTVKAERQGCLGVYGTTEEPGTVSIDDDVSLE